MSAPDTDPLVEATAAFRAAQKAETRAKGRLTRAKEAHSAAWLTMTERRADLAKIIVDQARHGRRNRDIRAITGHTAERIRQICREAGFKPPE